MAELSGRAEKNGSYFFFAYGRKLCEAFIQTERPGVNLPGLFLYNENPALGAGGSEALTAVKQNKKLLLM